MESGAGAPVQAEAPPPAPGNVSTPAPRASLGADAAVEQDPVESGAGAPAQAEAPPPAPGNVSTLISQLGDRAEDEPDVRALLETAMIGRHDGMNGRDINAMMERRIHNLMQLRSDMIPLIACACANEERGQRWTSDEWATWLREVEFDRWMINMAMALWSQEFFSNHCREESLLIAKQQATNKNKKNANIC